MSEISATFGDGTIEIQFDEAPYPKDAIYGSAYVFIDRCYVHLDRIEGDKIKVKLTAKSPALDKEALVDEFKNELIGQTWHRQMVEANRELIYKITATEVRQEPAAQDGFEDLLGMDLDDQSAFEDPLGIAMSWEDKYKGAGEKAT